MATVNTNDARTRNAQNLIDSFNECNGDASAYMFIGRTTPWENEDDPPVPVNNLEEYYSVHREMLSLTRINDVDLRYMVPRIRWMSGTVYDMYRHDYTSENRSYTNASTLYDAIFFVLSTNNYIYICLNNNGNKPSLVEPQNISNEPFVTSDGYQWVRLYKITTYESDSYSSNNLIPITHDEVNHCDEGAVYTVLVDDPGTRYTNNPPGPIQDVPDYYCRIVGDGTGAVAKVRVRSTQIESIEVVRPGTGYTFAKLDFVPGRVYKGIAQLDGNRNGLNPGGDNNFRSTVIISPPGGWGYKVDDDLEDEENNKLAIERLAVQLASRSVGVFGSFSSTLADVYPDVTFRQLGILKKVEYTSDDYKNADTLSAVKSIHIKDVEYGPFKAGDVITQEIFNPVFDHDYAVGKVVSYDEKDKIIRYVQNEHNLNEMGYVGTFSDNNPIVCEESGATANPVTDFFGSLGGVEFYRGYADSEIRKNKGYLTYLSNIRPVKREPTQTERISLVVSF